LIGTNYFYKDGLVSQRLKTKFISSTDAVLWTPFFLDPESVEFFPKSEFNTAEEKAAFWIQKQINRYTNNGYGLQWLIDSGSGEYIGQCGLLLQVVDGIEELEVGYHIFKKFRGNGYAPEAACLFLDFAFKNELADSVVSIIHSENVKSQAVARKNGLVNTNQTKWNNMDVSIYRIGKDEWL
jgi:RimJ/RimL family protein N-acetyltransferase